ncbi:MAG: 2-succinyl-5-enolpyruvyl-6-hydroxy-3-cyclohexene-1-carboxylic-acid synthase [Cyclobacteriaceae bacterium]|nr:2-succinyl-5-enolpyruvyl-6-hydroxy-3-cyclohexene-1-carboxylic-acid synthase [Cyclobacteriaceae bacterium]
MNHQQILNIPKICFEQGVRYAVISPGSRNALLSVAFNRHKSIKSYIIHDERSAGNIALGIAQSTQTPVVLLCTSGSAVYQYGGAVSEAFFMNSPLVVISADRPDEWIDQLDGQTIRQKNIFQDHVKKQYHLPVDTSHPDAGWQFDRTINEALIVSKALPQGPVHLNIPIREPFYSSLNHLTSNENPVIIRNENTKSTVAISESFKDAWIKSQKTMIVVGQNLHWSAKDHEILAKVSGKTVLISDIISNCNIETRIRHHDLFLNKVKDTDTECLKPDLLITFGNSVLSKSLKKFLRANKPIQHWHLGNSKLISDPFQSVTHWVYTNPFEFLNLLPQKTSIDQTYRDNWNILETKTENYITSYFRNKIYDELSIVNGVLSNINHDTTLHLANSMTVRYANFINPIKAFQVYANRGTSGLDTSNGTAVGHAMTNKNHHVLITGDMAFLYDTNSFWNQYLGNNLTIFILNNSGGGIFNIIDGPSQLNDSKEVFTAPYTKDLSHMAHFHGFEYVKVNDFSELENCTERLKKSSLGRTVVDITTNMDQNKLDFEGFRKGI